MPQKCLRISRGDFEKVFKNGHSLASTVFVLKFIKNLKNDEVGMSLVVSSSALKLATERNLLKRRGRAIVQKLLPRLAGGYSMIFIYRPKKELISFKDTEEAIINLLTKARILK